MLDIDRGQISGFDGVFPLAQVRPIFPAPSATCDAADGPDQRIARRSVEQVVLTFGAGAGVVADLVGWQAFIGQAPAGVGEHL